MRKSNKKIGKTGDGVTKENMKTDSHRKGKERRNEIKDPVS